MYTPPFDIGGDVPLRDRRAGGSGNRQHVTYISYDVYTCLARFVLLHMLVHSGMVGAFFVAYI